MLSFVKYLLWKLGLLQDNCPYDNSSLIQHGYPPNDYYSCPIVGCRFSRKPAAQERKA